MATMMAWSSWWESGCNLRHSIATVASSTAGLANPNVLRPTALSVGSKSARQLGKVAMQFIQFSPCTQRLQQAAQGSRSVPSFKL